MAAMYFSRLWFAIGKQIGMCQTFSRFLADTCDNSHRDNEVTMPKIIDLWINKQMRAFEIIKHDGHWPITQTINTTTARFLYPNL